MTNALRLTNFSRQAGLNKTRNQWVYNKDCPSCSASAKKKLLKISTFQNVLRSGYDSFFDKS